jgi:hypothetical protein
MGGSYYAADLTIMKFHPKYFVADVIDIDIYVMKPYCTSPLYSNQP